MSSSTPPKVRGKNQAVEALIEAAIELTSRKGPEGFSVREVAALAGVNHGLVHRHFGGKSELIRAAMNAMGARIAQLVRTDDWSGNVSSRVFEALKGDPRYLACLAWMMLSNKDASLLQDSFPTYDKVFKHSDLPTEATQLLGGFNRCADVRLAVVQADGAEGVAL